MNSIGDDSLPVDGCGYGCFSERDGSWHWWAVCDTEMESGYARTPGDAEQIAGETAERMAEEALGDRWDCTGLRATKGGAL